MLAISNSQHFIRQSALYMIQDTHFLEGMIGTITFLSVAASATVVAAAAVQVHVLKKLFDSRVKGVRA